MWCPFGANKNGFVEMSTAAIAILHNSKNDLEN